jgi:hypothetical protein
MEFEIAPIDVPIDVVRPKGRPKLPEGTKAERKPLVLQTEILKETIRLSLDLHYSQNEVFNYLVKKYDIKRVDASRYWRKSWDLIQDKFKQSKDELVKKHLIKLWNIHDLAIVNNDFTNARNALNDISKLIGLNSPDKLDITHHAIKLNFGQINNTAPIEGEK